MNEDKKIKLIGLRYRELKTKSEFIKIMARYKVNKNKKEYKKQSIDTIEN